MGKILCATRGGPAAVEAQEAAIERAIQQGDDLIFFYVVNVDFLSKAHYVLRSDVVTEQMDHMAEFLMTMAVERAEARGKAATYIVRHGVFADELEDTVREEGITLVVLGRPAHEESIFRLESLHRFAGKIAAETGVEVWIPGLEEHP